jgi:hypothetical protein
MVTPRMSRFVKQEEVNVYDLLELFQDINFFLSVVKCKILGAQWNVQDQIVFRGLQFAHCP